MFGRSFNKKQKKGPVYSFEWAMDEDDYYTADEIVGLIEDRYREEGPFDGALINRAEYIVASRHGITEEELEDSVRSGNDRLRAEVMQEIDEGFRFNLDGFRQRLEDDDRKSLSGDGPQYYRFDTEKIYRYERVPIYKDGRIVSYGLKRI